MTQVVMARLSGAAGKQVSAQASLTYTDATSQEQITTDGEYQEGDDYDLEHSSIQRNYAIALVAKSIHTAARFSNRKNNEKASIAIKQGNQKAKLVVNKRDDQHLKRVFAIAKGYQTNM